MNKYLAITFIITILTGFLFAEGNKGGAAEMENYLLLDDLRGERSAINTEWKGFTDQVMGGKSEMTVVRVPDKEDPYIRLQGRVSLENNGGFIQIRLKLTNSASPFDGSAYRGIRLKVRGEGTGYYIFLRTTYTLLPWKYYAAPVAVSEDWQTVDIPWEAFGPGDYGKMSKLRVNKLKSLALVAYGKEFDAKIDLKEIGLY